jgi:peptide/nickel transport system permease protein
MTAYLLRRLIQSVMLVAVMSVIVFFGIHVVGDPVWLLVNPQMDQQDIEAAVRALGLDRPIWEQYWYFVTGALRGDLGRSFIFGEPALRVILERMPATLELALTALVLAIVIGIPLGLYAGLKPESWISKTIMAGSILGFSLPTFWVGLMLIMVFAVMLGWLPSTGRGPTATYLGITSSLFTLEGLRHILLPAINLALLKVSLVIRLTRAGTREVLQQDYVRFARAKGLSERRVIGIHVLKNTLIPAVTVMGLEFGNLVAFSVADQRHSESRSPRDRGPSDHYCSHVRSHQFGR